jgi:glycosyltransferase involved in cell wall biosynthesis
MGDSTAADHPRRPLVECGKRLLLHGAYTGAVCAGVRSREYLLSLGFDERKMWDGIGAVDNGHFAAGASNARSAPSEQRARLELPEEYVLCVARHAPEKDIATLLRACVVLFRRRPNCYLVLCGSGPLTSQLHESAVALAIEDRVRFVGWVSYSELPYYYGLASATVLPSISEPWGLVVNESLAAGTPVIVSETCGCVPELVRRGVSGYTFPPGDSVALEAVLRGVLECWDAGSTIRQCQSVVAPWSIPNRSAGMADCVRYFGGLLDKG